MQALEKSLRNQLERTIRKARKIAETAAAAALEQVGVNSPAAYSHSTEEEKELRRKLRIHGRQLGDSLNGKKEQTIGRLVEEVAYEHWHRMLFARFLAENNLLMYPDPVEPVPVTLEECEDLAADEGAKNGWELAAQFASKMLPQIFRIDSPVFKLTLSPEHQQSLEKLLEALPKEVFEASDSLGWVYQFWQTENKERINKKEGKRGARELPAVTQLFTEQYMVNFLLDNSLGAWWAGKRLTENDLKAATSEEELRKKASIPGVPLEYLRFVYEDDKWHIAAGTFDAWPNTLKELKTLDPCCGSGHFLVAAFLMLVPMRMDMERLSPAEAVDKVLTENLHGLELDQRCVELAAFNLAFNAWKYPGVGYRELPELQVACSGLSVRAAKEEWKELALGEKHMKIALDWMYEIYKDAPFLGSLLDPSKTDAANIVEWEELLEVLKTALEKEHTDENREAAVVAQGVAKATVLLSGKYQLVITNVPYLARSKQNDVLANFCESNYFEGKNELATAFLDRCLEFCEEGGTSSIVLPQNWLFLTSYKKFREKLLRNHTWKFIARLGEGGFDSSAAAGAFTVLLEITKGNTSYDYGIAMDSKDVIRGIDVSEFRAAQEKAVKLISSEIKTVEQSKQLENPDARVALEEAENVELLKMYAKGFQGIASGDYPHFGRFFWEIIVKQGKEWVYQQSTVQNTCHFGGKQNVLYWENGTGELISSPASRVQGLEAWEKFGVAAAQMRKIPATLYTATSFDNNTAAIIPKDKALLPAIWCFCSSAEYNEVVRQVDQSLKVTNATLIKVPFDLERWSKIAEEKYPNGLPKPYTNDPTQWIFHGHPCGSVIWDEDKKWTSHGELRIDNSVLQIAVARLMGYQWPAELDKEMELADEQRAWVNRCKELQEFVDEDGIVCIPPVRGEAAASDRLLNILAASYGYEWSQNVLFELLNAADHAGKSLESWLRDKFFTQHFKMFQHRPFIWHVWDGLPDGFAALVNYHKLDYKNLETLIYTYLGDWISRQKQDISNGIDGAVEKLAAAEGLKKKLELILKGEAPYDIFVRWKAIEQQPIGWNPDLNDGVRLNIRPFMSVPDVKKKGAGVLRDKPNISWKKDRGKDVSSAPWYHLFKGDRINDHHLTIGEKQAAREKNK